MAAIRLQLNSRDASIDVYKKLPTLDLAKTYSITIENLVVPEMSDGLILNQELFRLEHRLLDTSPHTYVVAAFPFEAGESVADIELPVPAIFTPQNVKNASELVYQMNAFFRRMLLKQVTSGNLAGGAPKYALPDLYNAQDNEDWYDVLYAGDGPAISQSIEAIYRCDGRIGFKFSPAAQTTYVIKLSAEGKRIFGWIDYIAVDHLNSFEENYLYEHNGIQFVNIAAPNLTEDIVCVVNNSVFNHGHYRHELALVSTLPLQNYVECDQDKASFKRQLASYRYPQEPIRLQYNGTLFKVLKNRSSNIYIFEQGRKTHNVFYLTGTELQNFHIKLLSRNYKWDTEKEVFEINEKNYPLIEDSLWTVNLKLVVK